MTLKGPDLKKRAIIANIDKELSSKRYVFEHWEEQAIQSADLGQNYVAIDLPYSIGSSVLEKIREYFAQLEIFVAYRSNTVYLFWDKQIALDFESEKSMVY